METSVFVDEIGLLAALCMVAADPGLQAPVVDVMTAYVVAMGILAKLT